jgi:hypothetical protein
MRLLRFWVHDRCMDLVSLVLAVAAFGAIYALIAALDRV